VPNLLIMGFPVFPADGEYWAAVHRAATRLAGLRQGECKDTQAQDHKPREQIPPIGGRSSIHDIGRPVGARPAGRLQLAAAVEPDSALSAGHRRIIAATSIAWSKVHLLLLGNGARKTRFMLWDR
jgi:hypothetical protein